MKNRRDFLQILSTGAAAVIGGISLDGYADQPSPSMKKLRVKKVAVKADAPWDEVHKALDTASQWNAIDIVNWSDYAYRPKVEFRMVYCDSALLLQYKVKEQAVRAVAAVDNGEVWKDSCVEVFIKPDNDDLYYNFEFNCIGLCLLSVGTARAGREMATMEVLSKIRRKTSLDRLPFSERREETEWGLSAVIPFACFFKHPDYSPDGKTAYANFYKCGDDLTVPHFLSWNPIKADKPDFHRPECFGTVEFMRLVGSD